MITEKDLEILFHKDTGLNKDRNEREYYEWVEEQYLNSLNS